MDFSKILKRAIAIITTPNKEWDVIQNEDSTVVDLFTKYAVYLAAIPSIASFLGFLVAFRGIGFGRILVYSIFLYIFQLGSAFALAMIINALAPTFSASKDQIRSFEISIYGYTASWVFSLIMLLPRVGYLGLILSIYSLYIIYLGMKKLTDTPEDKLMPYFVTTVVAFIILTLFTSGLLRNITFGPIYG